MAAFTTKEALRVKPDFLLWTPPPGRFVTAGPQQRQVPLPAVPLPLHRHDLAGKEPTDDAVGRGVYDYLRQFPDCPHNVLYAALLRDAFSHFLADLGAQTAMLDRKEVDSHYARRKINGLKILSLLEPENPGLLLAIGIGYYDLALTFAELPDCRSHLLAAIGFLRRALAAAPGHDPAALNHLGQIDYFLGDYPAAARRWRTVMEKLSPGAAQEALAAKIARIDRMDAPDRPLVDGLEAIGGAMRLYGEGDFAQAALILERLEEEGTVIEEFPAAGFCYLLGMSRGKVGDRAGAFEAFEKALVLDPDFEPAMTARDLILDGKDL